MKQDNQTKITLTIEREILQSEDALVKAIEAALDTTEYLKSGANTLEESQSNNILSVDDNSDSPKVIKNMISSHAGTAN